MSSETSHRQMDIQCDYLNEEERCGGLYMGFGCIKHKCQQPNRSKPADCAHMRDDGFCLKLGKLFCPGQENCSSFES